MKNNFFLKSPSLVKTTDFPEYIRLLQYNDDSTSSTIPKERMLENYEYDTVGSAAADFLFDYKYGASKNIGTGNLYTYYHSLNRTDNGMTTLKARDSFFADFIVIECSDYGHQALSAFYRDFVPMVFCNGRKIWQKYVGTIRHSSSRKTFLLINPKNNVIDLSSSDNPNEYITENNSDFDFQVRICAKMATSIDSSWKNIKLDLTKTTDNGITTSFEENYITYKINSSTLTFLRKDNIDDYDVYYTYNGDSSGEYYRLANTKYFFTVKQEYKEYSTLSNEDDENKTFTLISRQSPEFTDSSINDRTDTRDYYQSYTYKMAVAGSDELAASEYFGKAAVGIYLTFRVSDTFGTSTIDNYTFYLSSKQIEADASYYNASVSLSSLLTGRSLASTYSPVDSLSYFDFYDSDGRKITSLNVTDSESTIQTASLGLITYNSETNTLSFSKKLSTTSTTTTSAMFEIIPNYTSTRKMEYNLVLSSDAPDDGAEITFNRLRFLKYIFPYNIKDAEFLIYEDGELTRSNEFGEDIGESISLKKHDMIYTLVLYDNGEIDTNSEGFDEEVGETEDYLSITNTFQTINDTALAAIRENFKRNFWSSVNSGDTPIPEIATDPYLNTEYNSLYNSDKIYTEVFPYELNEREDGSLLHLKIEETDDSIPLIVEPTFEHISKSVSVTDDNSSTYEYRYNSVKFNGDSVNSDEEVDDGIISFMKLNLFNSEISNPILSDSYNEMTKFISNADQQYENLEKNMMSIISDSLLNNVNLKLLSRENRVTKLGYDENDTESETDPGTNELNSSVNRSMLICFLSDDSEKEKPTTVFYTHQSSDVVEPSQLESRIISPDQSFFILFLNLEALGAKGTLNFYYGSDSPRYIKSVYEFAIGS